MDKLFPFPVYTFLKMVISSGGITARKVGAFILWLVKMILFEPLRWIELAGHNFKVKQHKIKMDPVFILGFYRSGTSYLHQFLTQDDRFGYHTTFQMIFPDMMLTGEKWMSPLLNALFRLIRFQDPVHRIPMSSSFPGEEDGAMTTAANPRSCGWGYIFPKRLSEFFQKYVLFENVTESEVKAWKREYLFLVKKISLANEGKQLVLKSPPNTARIPVLLSLFPNARFIMIHRNPYDVYASNKRFWKIVHAFYALGKPDALNQNQLILDLYADLTQRYFTDKHLIPEGQLIELSYEDFIQKPMHTIRMVYETLHLNDFKSCAHIMQKYVDRQKNYVRLTHDLPPDERKLVAEKLEPFIKYWKYA